MRKIFTVLFSFLLLQSVSCVQNIDSTVGTVKKYNEIGLPVVTSLTWQKISSLSETKKEFAFRIVFSKSMDEDSTEKAVYVIKVIGDMIDGENPFTSDAIVQEPVNDRFLWSDDDTVLIVKADLDVSYMYYVLITTKAKDKNGNHLDGKVGNDYNNDGKIDIQYMEPDELVRVDDDYLNSPADFISQPLIVSSLEDLKSYNYMLPNNSHPYLEKIEELDFVNGSVVQYQKNGNTIGVTDNGYSFNQPVKITSILELDFGCNYYYTENNGLNYNIPPCLINPNSISSNIFVSDEKYHIMTTHLYYDYEYKKISLPLEGTISNAVLSDTVSDLDNSSTLTFSVSVGETMPAGVLKDKFMVITDENKKIKYILKIIDNGSNSITVSALYFSKQGWIKENNYYYLDNAYLHNGELVGTVIKSPSSIFKILSNSTSNFTVGRISGTVNGFSCSYKYNDPPCLFNFYMVPDYIDFKGMNFYVASDKYYLKIDNLAESTKYTIEIGGISSLENVTDIFGNTITDFNRDGSSQDNPSVAENSLKVSFPTSQNGNIFSYTPTTVLNNGTYYPYVISSESCKNGICLDPDSYVDKKIKCGDQYITVKGFTSLFFSFYTPDGDKNSFCGYDDLMVEGSSNKNNILYFKKNANGYGIPVYEIKTGTVMGRVDESSMCRGGFLTTLVTVNLLPEYKECNGSLISVPTIVGEGDKLTLSHSIEALTSNPNSKFDGNRDGILEYNSEDDLRLIFSGGYFVKTE